MQSFTISPKRNIKGTNLARFALVIFALFANLCALSARDANLRDVNIKGNKEKLEILLLVDSAFENRVVKEDSRGFSSIIFKNLNYTKNKLSTKSVLVKNIEIFARGNDVYVVLGEEDLDLRFDIAVLNSSNALKIVIKPKTTITQEMLIKEIPNEISVDSSANRGADSNANQSLEDSINALKAQNQLITPSNSVESWRYALVIAILVALIIALLIAKKRTQNQSPKSLVSYFKKPQITLTQSINIDMKNKIIILDSVDNTYILFVGQHNAFVIDSIVKKRKENLPQIITDKENKITNLLNAYKDSQQRANVGVNQSVNQSANFKAQGANLGANQSANPSIANANSVSESKGDDE